MPITFADAKPPCPTCGHDNKVREVRLDTGWWLECQFCGALWRPHTQPK